jgi:hypothetical protein
MNSRSFRLQEQQQHPIPKDERKKVIGQPVELFSNNVGIDRTIKEACSIGGDLLPSFQRMFLRLPTNKDILLLADFIIDSYHERNIAVATKQAYITSLVYLSRYLGHKKTFPEMNAQDVIGYLNSIKRSIEADSDQRWVSTYNLNASVYLKFFKWLTQRDLPSSERKLSQVPMLRGLKFVKRKGQKHTSSLPIYGQLRMMVFS